MALSGCAGMGGHGLEAMSADQIREAAKMKDASIVVTDVNSVWGRVKTIFMSVDKAVIEDGKVTVTPEGSVTFENKKAFKPEPPAIGTTQTVTTTVVPVKQQ